MWRKVAGGVHVDVRIRKKADIRLTREPDENPHGALHRLLLEAVHGGQARVDALLALSQRTVFVAPWPAGIAGYRTLLNAEELTALPVFTDRRELEKAAHRYGWMLPHDSLGAVEIGAREAFHYVRFHSIAFVIVDIDAEHALEIGRDELAPLLSPAARRESSGPFAGTGRITSNLMRAVRAEDDSRRISSRPPTSPTRPPSTPPPEQLASSLRTSCPIDPIGTPFSEARLLALEPVLREFHEIEWACAGQSGGVRVLGLRIDPRVRHRLNEIADKVDDALADERCPIVLLDDPSDIRIARTTALVFYPWRRR